MQTREGQRAGAAEASGWFESLDRLFPIPHPFREEIASRTEALDTLRCGEEMLDALVERGLPHFGSSRKERFDRFDLFNLGLYSNSGRSLPELAFRFALRWMAGPPESWFDDRRWSVGLKIECGRRQGCGADPRWKLARPSPERFGGRFTLVDLAPTGIDLDLDCLEAGGGRSLSLVGEVETRGKRRRLSSPRLREIVLEYLLRGHRWIRMPEDLQRRPELVLRQGVTNCVTASLHLVRELHGAGFEARTRRGWALGVLDLEHSWIEVVDDDGEVKVLDPIFILLSRMVPSAHPELEEACLGSATNRVLPTAYQADQPLAQHSCDGSSAPIRRRTDIRHRRRMTT